jgi:hypothetical protein
MSEAKRPPGAFTSMDHCIMCDRFVELLVLMSAAQREPVSVRATPEWQEAQQKMKTAAANLLMQLTLPF